MIYFCKKYNEDVLTEADCYYCTEECEIQTREEITKKFNEIEKAQRICLNCKNRIWLDVLEEFICNRLVVSAKKDFFCAYFERKVDNG